MNWKEIVAIVFILGYFCFTYWSTSHHRAEKIDAYFWRMTNKIKTVIKIRAYNCIGQSSVTNIRARTIRNRTQPTSSQLTYFCFLRAIQLCSLKRIINTIKRWCQPNANKTKEKGIRHSMTYGIIWTEVRLWGVLYFNFSMKMKVV